MAKLALAKIDSELDHLFPDRIPHRILPKTPGGANGLRGAYLVLQLHDEFIFEVVQEDLAMVAEIVQRSMRSAMELNVPLQVKMKSGASWGSMQPYELISGDH